MRGSWADVLGTVSRELRRNAKRPERYRAAIAQWRAQQRAKIARRPRKLSDGWLRRYVSQRLRQGWSPQQIAARLRRYYPEDMGKRLGHETIYGAIYIVARGELRRTLIGCLRQHRKVSTAIAPAAHKRGEIANRTSIGVRPAEVQARLVPCHWEGDVLKCRVNGSALTGVEETLLPLHIEISLIRAGKAHVGQVFCGR